MYYSSRVCSHILSKTVAQAQKRVSPAMVQIRAGGAFSLCQVDVPSRYQRDCFRSLPLAISDGLAVLRPGRGGESERVLLQKKRANKWATLLLKSRSRYLTSILLQVAEYKMAACCLS